MRGRHIHRPGGMYDRLLQHLGDLPPGQWTSTGEIAEALSMQTNYIRDLLRDGVDDGLVEKPSHRSRRWRLIQPSGEHEDSRTHVTVKLTRNQAMELIRAAVNQQVARPTHTDLTDRVRQRALVGGHNALLEALTGVKS